MATATLDRRQEVDADQPAPDGERSGPEGAGRRRPGGVQLRHQPGLDGLRGLGLLAILANHAGFEWAGGAFLAVSMFFTLSGFLITALLLREYEKRRSIDRRAFWSRRFRRLLPAALAAVALIVVGAAVFADAAQRSRLRGDVLATLGYVANWRFIAEGDVYGGLFGAASPLQHFWSLAIEEQFYLLYPLLVIGVLVVGKGSRRVLAATLAVLTGVAVVWSVVLTARGAGVDRLYFGTDTRAAELLLGALLAVWWTRRGEVVHRRNGRATTVLGGAVALVVMLALWHLADHHSPVWYVGGLAAYAVLMCLVILAAMQPVGPVRSVMTWRPLVLLGLISYGAYLVHWPVFLWIDERTGLDPVPLLVVRLAVTLGLAVLSYHLIERPIRQGRVTGRQAAVAVPAVLAVTIAVALVVGVTTDGTFVDLKAAESAFAASRPSDAAGHRTTFSMYGDSSALTLGLGLSEWAQNHPEVLWPNKGFVRNGCGLLEVERRYDGKPIGYPPECVGWADHWREQAAANRDTLAVVLVGPWEVTEMRLSPTDPYRLIGDPVLDDAMRRKLTAAVDGLLASGSSVILLTSPDIEPGRTDGRSPPRAAPEKDPARMARWNGLLADVAATRPGRVGVVDLGGWFRARPDDDRRIRPDGVHFTWVGGREMSPWLGPEIARVAATLRPA